MYVNSRPLKYMQTRVCQNSYTGTRTVKKSYSCLCECSLSVCLFPRPICVTGNTLQLKKICWPNADIWCSHPPLTFDILSKKLAHPFLLPWETFTPILVFCISLFFFSYEPIWDRWRDRHMKEQTMCIAAN